MTKQAGKQPRIPISDRALLEEVAAYRAVLLDKHGRDYDFWQGVTMAVCMREGAIDTMDPQYVRLGTVTLSYPEFYDLARTLANLAVQSAVKRRAVHNELQHEAAALLREAGRSRRRRN